MLTGLRSFVFLFFVFETLAGAEVTFPKEVKVKNVEKFIKEMPKLDLHMHFIGSANPATLWDLAKKKGFPTIPKHIKDADQFADHLKMRDDGNLKEFLDKYQWMRPQLIGDLVAIERNAVDLCEKKAKEGCVYFEVKYAPHGLTVNYLEKTSGRPKLTMEQVVKAVQAGLKKGEKK